MPAYTKLLGRGDVDEKMHIKVDAAAARAKEKIEKMGGKIILRISRLAEKTKAGREGKEVKETEGREKETKVRGNK
jgi:ribosomal protein L18E